MKTLFKIKLLKTPLFQSRYCLLLLLVALWLPSNAQALTCKVDSFVSPNFEPITLANANNASVEQTLTYSCTNTSDVIEWASVCIDVDGGTNKPSQVNPRQMIGLNNSELKLNFNMTLSGMSNATWGKRDVGGTEFIDFFSVAPGITTPTIKETIIKTSLLSNTAPTADDYTATFTAGNTALTYVTVDSNIDTQQCLSESQNTAPFPFTVQAKVIPSCIINSASDIDLGSKPANLINIKGNSAINVTCTNNATYHIGLSPSNGNEDGAGVMTKNLGDSNGVPYQLRSTSGDGGMIWGNTATSEDVGNGVKGKGSGAPENHNVYVTVPSLDFEPGNYSDTVTINVNY
ncbi:hypothetical protein AOC03_12030 (plasmid) [Psychrobacter urativorans]|uniref:Spore coat protein U/FanG domain-containing protein n=1 Tax=Psychrobacter urativorans TaxID=45610 RepID=A0A0M3V9G8_9GAMM|nr:hypothetical protein AOC03_12030 [Psychrobacter urativorans]